MKRPTNEPICSVSPSWIDNTITSDCSVGFGVEYDPPGDFIPLGDKYLELGPSVDITVFTGVFGDVAFRDAIVIVDRFPATFCGATLLDAAFNEAIEIRV